MGKRRLRRDLRLPFLVLSLFLIEETLRAGLPYLAGNGGRRVLEWGVRLNPSDAELSFRLARLYHVFMVEDNPRVKALYIASIKHNPLDSRSFLGLAELFTEAGERGKALLTLRRAIEIAPKSSAILWEAGLIALTLGERGEALEVLCVVARIDPSRRRGVFELLMHEGFRQDEVMDRMTPHVLSDYLNFLISMDKLPDTYPVWRKIKDEGVATLNTALSYVDYLIKKGDSTFAYSIWSSFFGGGANPPSVWNGGFENDPIGRGFDWRIEATDGVRIDFDSEMKYEGRRSLRLRFDGRHNLDFRNVYQVVPVDVESSYEFTSMIALNGITTSNGLLWEAYCYPRGGMRVRGDTITGTTVWKAYGLSFHTPHDCRSVVIRLRRMKSSKFDRYISGTAWVDDVKIKKIENGIDADGRKKGI